MDIQAERQHLLMRIRQHADPEYQATVRRTVPTGLKVYGLTSAPASRHRTRLGA
jgi:hypothetical protein